VDKREGAVEGMGVGPAFWAGKHVLLTGHTGFKGSWLSLWLQRLGAVVTGYALEPPTKPSLFETANVASGMNSIIGDVRDLPHLSEVFQSTQPEIVIHMAAQPLVRESYVDPVGTYATNVMGTVHVLECARQTESVRVVLVVTSDKCYENREWIWGYRESDPVGGHDPYSSSKGCAELVTSAYRRSFLNGTGDPPVGLASARSGNVIGGGDWATDRLVPDAMRAFMSGCPLKVRNPGALRPWQHVLEPLAGYLVLCKRLYGAPQQYAEAWNFGPRNDETRPVSYLADSLARLWGDRAAWETDHADYPHEANYLKLDSSKAFARLGWTLRWSLDQAIAFTVDWYRAYARGAADLRQYTLDQIMRYESDLERTICKTHSHV
jgi:CDP-glucose 4,6-dehydratase